MARVYAHDLTAKTLKDIQPHLSLSMDSLLAELNAQTDIQVHYTRSSYEKRRPSSRSPSRDKRPNDKSSGKSCSLCKCAGRTFKGHDISSCWYLSKFEKLEMAKALRVTTDCEDDSDAHAYDEEEEEDDSDSDDTAIKQVHFNTLVNSKRITPEIPCDPPSAIKRVESDISPFFYAFLNHHLVKIVVDSGAMSSCVSRQFLRRVGNTPESTQHSARGADKTKLNLAGEIR